jgi:hypothetical protein
MHLLRKTFLAAAALALLALPASASPEPPWTGRFNCSGTITAGGTAQPLANLPAIMHGLHIQNLSTDTLAFSEMTTSPAVGTAGAWELAGGGGSYTSPTTYSPQPPIYIIGATTSDAFTCVAW